MLADWLENANNGEGPDIDGYMSREAFDVVVEAVERRDEAQRQVDMAVAQAREEGASWYLIGQALGVTKQGAFSRYAHPRTVVSA